MQRQNSKPISKIEIENWFYKFPGLETDTGTPSDIFLFLFLLVVSCGKRAIERRSELVLS